MGLRERADNRIKLSKRVSSSALVPDKNKLNYFASKPITWSIRFLKLSADSFLPGSPWRVFWNRPIALALLLAFSLCLSGETNTRSRGEGLQDFRPSALA